MTAVSSVNISSQSSVDARSHTAQSRSARSPSLLHLVKAAGVLALALSGGAQAAGVRQPLPVLARRYGNRFAQEHTVL